MHVYVRPRLAAAASRLIMGPWAAQSTRGPYRRPARSLWTLTRELYAEGRVLGSQLSDAPPRSRQVSEGPAWDAAWTEPEFKAPRDPSRQHDGPRMGRTPLLVSRRLFARERALRAD